MFFVFSSTWGSEVNLNIKSVQPNVAASGTGSFHKVDVIEQ